MTRSGAELASLVSAQRARAIALGWLTATIVLCTIGAMAAVLGLVLWSAPHIVAGVLAAVALGAGISAIMAAARFRASSALAKAKLGDAWERVAADILRARDGEMAAADLATVMSTDEAHAEELLASLSVESYVRVSMADSARADHAASGPEAGSGERAPGASRGRTP